MKLQPVTAVIVGGGHRAIIYADYSLKHPDELKIVGIAEPDEYRREEARKKYNIPKENCFYDADELAKRGKIADAVINGTMDMDHVKTSIPLLKLGYDMLLEKPFAVNKEEMDELVKVVKENNNKVMICHVLRYSDFYKNIKSIIANGTIGKIISIQLCEDVSYHHYATSYIRGKWANSDECGTSMLLAKCCHDIDLMMWMMNDTEPEVVTSAGSLMYFRKENAPENAGTRCMVDCPNVDTCSLSARRIYLDLPGKWDFYVWPTLHDASYEEKYEYLKNVSEFGRCAYKCNNNVVDHQSVLVKFKSGATGTHNLTGNTAFSQRIIRVVGTKGEIEGTFEKQKFTVSMINPHKEDDHIETVYDLSADCSASIAHGGGDEALVTDFVKIVRGEEASISCTSIEDSVAGHGVVFAADKSMENGSMPVKI